MTDPTVADGAARTGGAGIVGDSSSKGRLAALGGALRLGQDGRAFKSRKQDEVARKLRRALQYLVAGDAAKASTVAQAALELDERHGKAWHVLAIAMEKGGDLQKAFLAYEAAVKLLPDDSALVEDLGTLAHRLGYLDVAEKLYHKRLSLGPGHVGATNNLACVLRDSNRYGEAIELLKGVIAVNPDSALLWNTLGTVLSDEGTMQGSVVFFEEALRLDPRFYRARYNLANVRMALGAAEEALESIDLALRGVKAPADVATMKMAKAFTQMMLGDLGGGFDTYETRFSPALADAVAFDEFGNRWSPRDDLQGKTLLIYGEQDLGDEILFANLLADVIAAVGPKGQVILATDARLAPLFKRSYPSIIACSHLTVSQNGRTRRSVVFDTEIPAIDFWTPLGSLFRGYRTTVDQFPRDPGFLKADPDRIAHWQQVLQDLSPAPKVGILWKSLNMKGARARSFTPFDLWQPVLETKGVQFVNLQYGDCSAELAQAEAAELNVWTPPGIDLKADLDDVAALCCALDLVVGPMTATLNIAAACGVPAWVISTPDSWPRFGTDGLPCYPSARLFPADGFGEWEGVMSRIERGLREDIVGTGIAAAA